MPEKRKCPEKRFMYYRLLVRVLLRIAGVRGMVLPHGMAGRCSRDRSRMNRAEAFVAACELLTLHGFKRAVVTPEHLAVYFGGADRKGEDNVYALLLHLLRAEGVALVFQHLHAVDHGAQRPDKVVADAADQKCGEFDIRHARLFVMTTQCGRNG